MTNWTTWWSRAQRGLGFIPQKCPKHHRIVMDKIPKSKSMRLKFAAYYDSQAIKIKNAYCYDGTIKKQVTFKNQNEYLLDSGSDVYSDEIEINSQAIRIEYDLISASNYYCVSGFEHMDYDGFIEAPQQVYGLVRIDLKSDELNGCICVFGDSIVEQGNYTRIIQKDLKEIGYSLINLGLSGNRLLKKIEYVDFSATDNQEVLEATNKYNQIYQDIAINKQCFGISGVDRYLREVLSCQNIKAVIIAIGVNDIYQPGTFCSHISELPTLKQLQDGYLFLEKQTRQIPIISLQLTSFVGNPHATSKKEQLRLEINKWLNEYFERSVGFDYLLINNQLKPGTFQDDCLHPNSEGGKIMAKEIKKCLNTLF